MKAEDYPFTSLDGIAGTCKATSPGTYNMLLNKSQPSSWANGTDRMIAQLAKGPVVVAVDGTFMSDYA